jgi:hypothetical protein
MMIDRCRPSGTYSAFALRTGRSALAHGRLRVPADEWSEVQSTNHRRSN